MNIINFKVITGDKRIIIGLILLTLSLLKRDLIAQQQSPREYEIKAVFVYNFTQFIDWPGAVFDNAEAPMVIGVFGTDPFGKYLDKIMEGEIVSGHSLEVHRFNDVEGIDACQILYVGTEDKNQLKMVFDRARSSHMLTVGDGAAFIKQGGMIRLFTEDNKIRIQINLTAVKTANLKVSSKLLRLAEIVEP